MKLSLLLRNGIRTALGPVVCAAWLLAGAAAQAQTIDESIDQAVELFETRHLDADYLQQSYALLNQLATENPGNLRAHFELSHVCYITGDAAKSKSEKLKYYDLGYAIGKQAVEIDANSADAHLWLMVNRGRQGQTRGVLNSLFMIPELKREIATVLRIDPQNTVAMDVKGNLYYEVPGFAGGDLNVAQQTLNQGIELDSNYTVLYIDMAKVQIARKNYERARWYLNRCLAVDTPTYPADFALDDKPDAERMLGEIKDK